MDASGHQGSIQLSGPGAAPEPGQGSSRFFYAEGSPDCDETTLTRWWNHTGLDRLGEIIDAMLAQSMEMAKARVRMEQTIGSLSPDDGSDRARSMHLCICAMANFQFIRTKLIGRCAGAYVGLLVSDERLKNLEHAISLQQAAAHRVHSSRNEQGHLNNPPPWLSSPIAELHAFHERLRGDGNQALLRLSQELCEPPHVTQARVDGHALPASMASMPRIGSPEDLLLRRADIVSRYHHLRSEDAQKEHAESDFRHAQIDYEHASLIARNDVDRAVNRLRTSINALTPVRACAATAEAHVRVAQQEMLKGNCTISGVSDAHIIRFNRNDQEIILRGETYLALCGLFEALGAGWECVDFMASEDDSGASE